MIPMGKPKHPKKKKPVLVPLGPPQITQRLPWIQTHTSVVRGQQLTALTMAQL